MKKRKLGSKNPKYLPAVEKEEITYKKVLINDTGGAKIYAVYEIDKNKKQCNQ